MPTITNGTVEFERSVKVADYENKKAKVSLSFGVEENTDAMAALSYVAQMARHQVLVTLELPLPEHAAPAAGNEPAKEVMPGNRAIRTRKAATPPEIPAETKVADAGAIPDDETPAPKVADAGAIPDDETPAPKEPEGISDARLQEHVEHTRGRGVTFEQVKKLIAKFVDEPNGRMVTIKQEKRGKFIAALDELKKGEDEDLGSL